MGISTSLSIALEAITKDSDHAENDDVIKIGPKKGMGSNYERLEFLGDTFLKLVCKFPQEVRTLPQTSKSGNNTQPFYQL